MAFKRLNIEFTKNQVKEISEFFPEVCQENKKCPSLMAQANFESGVLKIIRIPHEHCRKIYELIHKLETEKEKHQ